MDEDDDDPVPLPNVNGAIMRKVGSCSHTIIIFKWAEDKIPSSLIAVLISMV